MNVQCGRWMSCFEYEILLSEILLLLLVLLVYALLPLSCRISSATIMNGSIFHFHLSSHKKTRKILLLITSRPPLRLEETVADWLDWPLPWPAVLLRHSFTPSLSLSFFLLSWGYYFLFLFFLLSVCLSVSCSNNLFLSSHVRLFPFSVRSWYFSLLSVSYFLPIRVFELSFLRIFLSLYLLTTQITNKTKILYLALLLHYVHNSTEFKIQPLCVCVHACAPNLYISTRKVIVVKQFVM